MSYATAAQPPRRRPLAAAMVGFTLIELMVVVAIAAILMAVAAPSFQNTIREMRVRSTAESIQAGIAQARTEAIRQNAVVRFQFVSTLSSSCALSSSGSHWLLNASASVSPAGACSLTPNVSSTPFIVATSADMGSSSNPAVIAMANASGTGVSTVAFDGLGRQTVASNPTTSVGTITINVTPSSGTCLASGGTVRCLRVVVSAGGSTRLCDPSITSSSDPRICP